MRSTSTAAAVVSTIMTMSTNIIMSMKSIRTTIITNMMTTIAAVSTIMTTRSISTIITNMMTMSAAVAAGTIHGHEEHEHHHHDHGGSCGCGHDHEHEEHEHHHHDHDHGDSCGCGHDHGHEEHEHHHEHSANTRRQVYIIENLGCAHCASKMEEKINALPGVEEATITFATKQLRVLAADPDALLPEMQHICSSIESEVKIVPKTVNASAKTKVYIIDGLDCAHCAAKVEERINEVPGVENAVLTFATKQLRITAKNPDALIDEIRRVSVALEPEVTIVERDPSPKSAAKDAVAKSAKEDDEKKERQELISIIIGAVFFVVGEILSHMASLPS